MAAAQNHKAAFPLPPGIGSEEVAALAEVLRTCATSRDPSEGSVEMVEVRALGMEGPAATDVLLVVSGLAGTWFTKKWVDEYIWPSVRRRIDRPSKSLIEWLDKTVAGLSNQSSSSDKDPR